MTDVQNRAHYLMHRRWLAAILGLAILARVLVAIHLGDVVDAPRMLTDQRSYDALAERLLSGHGFSFDRSWYPFTLADEPTAHWSFLYSLLVAGIYALFGAHPLAVRLIQSAVGGAVLPIAVYHLAHRYFPTRPTTWLWAASLTAFYAYFILYSTTIMTETIYIIFLVISIDLSMQIGQSIADCGTASWRIVVVLGLLLGATALVRQSILPWLPILYFWLLHQASKHADVRLADLKGIFARLAVSGMMVLLVILPWTYRNYQVYGEFLLLNSNAGYAMYSAQHPMHGNVFQEYRAAPVPRVLLAENEAVKDKVLMRMGIGFVLDEPLRYIRLCLSRARAFIEFWPSADTTFLHNLGRVLSFGLYLPFYGAGWMIVMRTPALRQRMRLPALFATFYAILHILTWAMVRYRLPVDAVLMPVAALAVDRAAGWSWRWLCPKLHKPDAAQRL